MNRILNIRLKKKELKNLLFWGFKNFRIEKVSKLTEVLKQIGFNYSTQSGISIDLIDLKILTLRNKIINSKKNVEVVRAPHNLCVVDKWLLRLNI